MSTRINVIKRSIKKWEDIKRLQRLLYQDIQWKKLYDWGKLINPTHDNLNYALASELQNDGTN